MGRRSNEAPARRKQHLTFIKISIRAKVTLGTSLIEGAIGMKRKIIAGLMVSVGLAAAQPALAANLTLFNTGVNAAGVALGNNSAETHYSLVSGPVGISSLNIRTANSAEAYPIGPWIGDSTVSSWIGPVGTDLIGPGGDYVYRYVFSLAGFDPSSVVINGRWAADDSGSIIVNGTNANQTVVGFENYANFQLQNLFVAGTNQIDFKVNNGGGPTGLRVEFTSATANPLNSAVPEPATWAMMMVGFGLIGAAMRRKRQNVSAAISFA